tara:strand:+ start:98 stop:301 length:204 start_codon:yes stop_codon:yes gene_type:complete
MTQHLIVLNKIDKLIDDLERDGFKSRDETLTDLREIRNELVHVNTTLSNLIDAFNQNIEIDKNHPYM